VKGFKIMSLQTQLKKLELFTQEKTRLKGCDSNLQLSQGMSYETKIQRAELGLKTIGKMILALHTKKFVGNHTCLKLKWGQVQVACAYNPSYSGGRDQEARWGK
jgi:hypothetical protein